MDSNKQSRWLLSTAILSLSLLTVMAGAAIAPALGVIQQHFWDKDPLLVQMLLSVPALFIILTNFVFPWLCQRFTARTLVLGSLVLYILSGLLGYFITNLYAILFLRAFLGISVGILMPLSTGLLIFYFDPSKQAKLMGLSSSMNYLGGVVATLVTGVLCMLSWNAPFLVYAMALIALVPCALYLPADRIAQRGQANAYSLKNFVQFHPYIIGMLFVMSIFFIYPTNFAIQTLKDKVLPPYLITYIMAGMDVIAFLMGLKFGQIYNTLRGWTKYLPPFCFLLGYFCLSLFSGWVGVVLGSLFVGMGSGIGIPYIYAKAAQAAGKEATTTVLPILSGTLYLGQFITPFLVSWGGGFCGGEMRKAYVVALVVSFVLLVYTVVSKERKFQD